jgi:hypothetical protein
MSRKSLMASVGPACNGPFTAAPLLEDQQHNTTNTKVERLTDSYRAENTRDCRLGARDEPGWTRQSLYWSGLQTKWFIKDLVARVASRRTT